MDNFTSLYEDYDLADNTSTEVDYGLFSNNTMVPEIHRPLNHALRHVKIPVLYYVLFKVVYVAGILGNFAAIFILRTGERRVRNRKHLLLLTALAVNDLIALVGMLTAHIVSENVPDAAHSQLYCMARVVLRVFGIGSVCIAVTMALERYLALTRPFLYHKQVTYVVIRTALLISWFVAALLTCAPILGWGAYWNASALECVRYKNPRDANEFAYAAVYIAFGTLLCVVLVYCNVAVIIALLAISSPRAGAPAVRRVSRRSCPGPRAKPRALAPSAATAEEVAFSRLMASLSVLFMFCWLPQMVTSMLFLAMDSSNWSRLGKYSMMSDLLMLLNYVLNPILYVLWRRTRSLRSVWRAIATCCKRQRHKSLTDSTKTAHCLQDTLLTSESSGAELKPLRTRIVLTHPPQPPMPQIP